MIEISDVFGGESLESVRALLREYAAQMHDDYFTDARLWRQNLEDDLKTLPRGCVAPDGCLLLASIDESAAGCVALSRLTKDACEMRRMYVKPEFRNRHLGRMLASELINRARTLGYDYMRLDTLPSMQHAQSLYATLGFRLIPAYNDHPLKDAVYMELAL